MSKSNPSELKATAPAPGLFSGLKALNLQVFVMIAAIVVIMMFFTWTTDGSYLSARNVSNLLRQTAITGILAVGMVFVIISAEIDLSVGSMMGLLGGLAAIFDVWLGWPLPLTIVVTLILGLLLGTWNGWWVAYRKVPSFIVTLAGMLAFRGILIGVTNGTTVSPTSASMSQIGQSYLSSGVGFSLGAIGLMAFVAWQWRSRMRRQTLGLATAPSTAVVGRQALTAVIVLGAIWLLNDYRGVPTPVLLLVLLMLAGMFMATRTAFGRRIYAIGGNLEAARLSGINVERTKLAVFAINGLMVAVAGLILSSRLGAGSPSAGNIAELDAIAACVIGGTSLAGGIGSVAGAVMGAFIMASLDNGMSMMDVPTFWQYIVKGAILLLAVWMDSATKRRA
ncbi:MULTISPECIES: xylose ABC transporter permease XylH [Leclercia]|jgi:D-xylose transport system permease protein|uniref:Xylose transport system permease protein XylH n=2 Tax=Leclercia adecarboxylata TaxID=83655 RepID=A0A855F702_9ENTR|nr:xylose ABC transporter permease XylH [Leclercia adecarboxylata]KFC92407.1 permease component of an ABC superfamily ribose transporter [Leclercia adecarboxylata ATCC 23216 = NBRC 102595]MBZ3801817.1 sugar ABC transporter permease [Leclercia adecarboxylata]MBZ3806447.1 sugar ABC transporter permease [Leclercia adecarboxylata]MCU6672623.1 sugar ABC transporter permease [Leclercia adecarboxylata]MCV3302774.1 sugar ABC transporter permease [Leclercia adecarboxylata]